MPTIASTITISMSVKPGLPRGPRLPIRIARPVKCDRGRFGMKIINVFLDRLRLGERRPVR